MARILPVPVDIWNRLHNVWMRNGNLPYRGGCLFDDANNEDTTSEALLVGRQQKALAEAEASDLWDFVVSQDPGRMYLPSLRKQIRSHQEHHFFIAKDEAELDAKVSLLETMTI
jgi:hypothetical protein